MATGVSTMDWESTKVSLGKKRTIEVDPDTLDPLQDSKKPKIQLNASKKVKCLSLIVDSFAAIVAEYFPVDDKSTEKADQQKKRDEAVTTLQISIQVSNIIFTLHTYKRQVAAGKSDSNIVKKSATTDFTITHRGTALSKSRAKLIEIWDKEVDKVGLEYKVFSRSDDEENWYGTFGPYIDFFCGFGLRMKELRLGHDKMPIKKRDDVMVEIPIKKYGLNGAHHILMEGSTFPPEKRSSMAQSVGPMTAFLSMIRSEGIFRAKWAAAVKRAFNHIPVIDDIIEVTKTQKKASDLSTMIGLLAEIILITTSRQATRAFFPIAFLLVARNAQKNEEDKKKLMEFFNTTGSGAFYVYKIACQYVWYLTGSMTEETAGQVVFHSIFGTYKEDLGILEEITDVGNWKTREDMGKCFIKGTNLSNQVKVKLPKYRVYSKLSCANMSGLLSGVYNQVSSIPSFSGMSMRAYGDDFFEHIDRRMVVGSTGKSISQITASLSITLEELRRHLKDKRGALHMGTVNWRSIADLDLDHPGSETAIIAKATGKYFMGRKINK